MLSCDAYLMPTSLVEAFAAMESHRGRYRLVAGARAAPAMSTSRF
jgi:hypothetical protein